MYRAFNLVGHPWGKISRELGDVILNKNKLIARESLASFLDGQIIDGTRLTSHWFPTIAADVFISHSHNDEEDAVKCAGWLKEQFHLDSFIDSSVWGHADDLLKMIDDKYCRNTDRDTYSYEKRNGSTSHVHMMLSGALSAMLDSTECVIFLNTRNSITAIESIAKTPSPWLSYELGTMRVIRRTKPPRKQKMIRNFTNQALEVIKAAEFKAQYEVPLSELTPLSVDQLNTWKETCEARKATRKDALDILYDDIVPE